MVKWEDRSVFSSFICGIAIMIIAYDLQVKDVTWALRRTVIRWPEIRFTG